MSKPVVLITGVNGEIGRSLLRRMFAEDRYSLVTIDLTPIPDRLRSMCEASYSGNILDSVLLNQIAAHHEIEGIFHLAALLSTRSERDPELAHQVNVEGTLNLLRVAQAQSGRLGRPVRFLFPSSIAAYGLPDLEEKERVGRIREEQWNLPITMYGCNKLYCEQVGRYYMRHFRQLGAMAELARLDFRALRFPGLISAETVPTGGTSDYGPEMVHAAAKGNPYHCFVGPDATIPFMAMPDAVGATLKLFEADHDKLGSAVYNVGAFSVSAQQIAERVKKAFAGAQIDFAPDPVRAKIVDSWPADVDDSRARRDWDWDNVYDFERAFSEYLLPNIAGSG